MSLNKKYVFIANGNILLFKGYLTVYQEGQDIDEDNEEHSKLPFIVNGEKLPISDIEVKDSETKPPARYNEASIIKMLEQYGIGRPSTYATIPKTLKDRGYIEINSNRITVTPIGLTIIKYLSDVFHTYVDYGFTADMETSLDEIEEKKINKNTMLLKFWYQFIDTVKSAENNIIEKKGVIEKTSEVCPQCGRGTLNKILGRYGEYLKCSCKECKYTRSLENLKAKKESSILTGKKCPLCNGDVLIRDGFRGKKFGSCSNYPKCKYTCNKDGSEIEVKEKVDTGVKCKKCKKNNILVRTGNKSNKKFFACGGFPKCKKIYSKDDFKELSKFDDSKINNLLS